MGGHNCCQLLERRRVVLVCSPSDDDSSLLHTLRLHAEHISVFVTKHTFSFQYDGESVTFLA